ncbi:hypothetical protein AXX17_ATUG03170 (mitochondrion) [Arabidopsis thaliana]|uniref:Uncharacterized protein n=1 Tax=Arabidopsis thaliana TaxID=3702 RepID=A0A178U7W6_ARATH|nr:hypothetical protein AXX17_ATUG03170 [Arabidopsis thaliana]
MVLDGVVVQTSAFSLPFVYAMPADREIFVVQLILESFYLLWVQGKWGSCSIFPCLDYR